MKRPSCLQFLKFGIVGGIGFVVDSGVLYGVMGAFGFGPYLARFFSFLAAVSVTWFCNRHFTFKGQSGTESLSRQWARFAFVNAFGFGINYGTYALLLTMVPLVYAHPILGVAAGSITGMFFNFFASKKIVFRAS